MATLKPHHKEKIVKDLACFREPSEIQKELKQEYHIEASLPQLAYYNPENAQSKEKLAPRWKDLFWTTRDKFIEGAIQIPIANKMYRLQELQQNYLRLKRMGNIPAANQVLEQAAKEMGGAFEAMKDFPPGGATQNNFYIDLKQKIIQQNNKNA